MHRLLVRADGSPAIGAGHLMRCLALAQAWQDAGGEAQFLTSGEMPGFAARLAGERMAHRRIAASPGSIADADETADRARNAGADWVAADGYHFDAAWRDRLRQAGVRILFVDDGGGCGYRAPDWVLNQNLHADGSLYAGCEPAPRLLLGPRYALLRREFRLPKGRRREIRPVGSRLLVTFGGSDPDGITACVLGAMRGIGRADLEARIVIGPANQNPGAAVRAAADLPFPARIERNPAHIAELMEWADLAVSAAGSTCWEMACRGLPQLVLAVAPNQEPIAAALDRGGLAESLGPARMVHGCELAARIEAILADAARRARLAGRGQDTVDGTGATRVVGLLREACAS